ncbi:GAF domain-containing sensor histidine kinase [Simiduia sp. 21SJ11W-1]|uniref:GAF domain-containing sensor histidine kinase n=1 Tax=Simiduia sp. 21SJ11W-1 TaxID=2909669 RepID=UPI0020A0A44C|nr:GAF domain-containing sensor histidine kinase [Simiduia sp. 21SJ11W-1]UTA47184.1 GAF domain-containing sensor histidine kinase [Simiduia sp. 21SJ11W-1]
MKSAPFHPLESDRLALLEQYQIMDSEAEAAFDDLTEIASAICGTPISLISLVDENRQWFKSKVGLDADETPRSIAFCSHAILQDEVFEVPNATEDERFADNPLVESAPDIRFYAGAPLITEQGLPLGTLCVIDQQPKHLTDVQRQALKTLAKQVVTQLELRLHNRRLIKLNKNREKMFAVIAHDLRAPFNSILGFSRRLSSKADAAKPERVVEMSNSILNAATNVYQLLDELLQWSQQRMGAYSLQLQNLPLSELVNADLQLLGDALPLKSLTLTQEVPPELEVRADSTLTNTVLRNLLANAIKYSPKGGEITLHAEHLGGEVVVSVTDQGPGIDAELAGKLFTGPVESQLGSYGEHGHGIGLGLCYDFVRMQHGRIWLDRDYTAGTRICFTLPPAE